MPGLGTPIHFHLYGVLACAVVTILVAVRNFLPRISPAQKIKDDVARLTAANSPEAPRELVTEPVTEPGTADLHTSEPSTAEPAVLTQPSGAVPYRSPWLEPRTLLIGVLVLAAALTEGSAMDWLAVTVKAELTSGWAEQSAEAMGAVALGIFLCAMTAMRLFGNGLLDRHTRVSVLRLSAALGLVGLLLFGLSPWLWLATIGIALWGLGAALAFPVGISAASDDPLRAARRVSVVASVGYASSLAAPPLIGLAADHLGYRNTLLLIAIPAAIGFLIASKAAPLPGSRAAKKKAALLAQKALQYVHGRPHRHFIRVILSWKRDMTYQIRNARLAVVASFAMCGFSFANWASRLPVVDPQLPLSARDLGILLPFATGGSLSALPVAGALPPRIGTARVVGLAA